MNKTNIEWVKNPDGSQGYTWNPITGCLNHTPEGLCLGGGFPCYAYRLANGRLRQRYLANDNYASVVEAFKALQRPVGVPQLDPFYPRFWPERVSLVGKKRPHSYSYVGSLKGHKPKGVFVCDMGELFGDWVPERWTQQVIDTLSDEQFEEWRFYLLTKQPQNLAKWSPFPPNCWVGVTATREDLFWKALSKLKKIEAKVKFISVEPFLDYIHPIYDLEGVIDWLIIGAQTKPDKFPKPEWVQAIIEAADKAGVPVFLKDNLIPLFERIDRPFPCLLNNSSKLRQEIPNEEQND